MESREIEQFRLSSIADFVESVENGEFSKVCDCVLNLSKQKLNEKDFMTLLNALTGKKLVFKQFCLDLNEVPMNLVSLKTLSVIAATNVFSSLDLSLQHCSINGEGAEILAECLWSRTLPVNTSIDLYGNSIRDQGTKAMAEALKSGKAPAGLTLELGNNDITCDGINELMAAVKDIKCPQDLKIKFGYYDVEIFPAVENLISALDENDKKHRRMREAIRSCPQFQEGAREEGNIIQQLPKEICGEIYSHVFDVPVTKKIQKTLSLFNVKPRLDNKKIKLEEETERLGKMDGPR